MRHLSKNFTLVCLAASLLAAAPAQAVTVNVNLFGTVTSGGNITGQSFVGQSVQVGLSYDTVTVGAGGIFSGGINFLGPILMLNGLRYVNFGDRLALVHPTTLTVVNGAADSLAVDFDADGYVGISNRSESLTINFTSPIDFISNTSVLPASANVQGAGTGSFSLLYVDDCQNYACGPSGVFYAGASFDINRLEIGASAVPEPASYGLLGLGLMCMALNAGRRRRA